jgi:hypothetical protein
MSPELDDDNNSDFPFERDFARRDPDPEQGGLGAGAFHGTLLICALVSLYLRIIGIGGG